MVTISIIDNKNIFDTQCDVIVNTINCVGVMGKGIAEIVEDVEIKKNALTYLMKTQTGKDFEFNDKLVSVVSVIKIDVSEYTAKKQAAKNTRKE